MLCFKTFLNVDRSSAKQAQIDWLCMRSYNNTCLVLLKRVSSSLNSDDKSNYTINLFCEETMSGFERERYELNFAIVLNRSESFHVIFVCSFEKMGKDPEPPKKDLNISAEKPNSNPRRVRVELPLNKNDVSANLNLGLILEK